MKEVSIRELRNHSGEVVDRFARGEPLLLTRAGKPVAMLQPLPREPLTSEALIARWRHLPPIDPVAFRRDIDALFDTSL